MDSAAWLEIKEIFSAALASPAAGRAALLDERCAGREGLRAEVEAFLAAHTQANAFLETPAIAAAPWVLDQLAPSVDWQRVGPFRLVAPIGAGGMGVVHRAERVEGGFEQQVAIKIIGITWRDAEALSRFRVERQILATLHHPNIVQFIDGGLTADGRAFLVMEIVEGMRLTAFCLHRSLGLDARLQLFTQVCEAVQYAHQRGVVHRDLKPGNILVTVYGHVKVLDFGIAKLIAPGEADATRTGMRHALTPDYASPEQLRGLPVTTASDIYALGVVLYELVSGRKPYETTHETLDRVLEIVTQTDPVRPSQTRAAAAEPVPYGSDLLRGDLDAIVMKAMQKDPARRYASAQELVTDLARFRASEPVLAREPSLGYLVLKTARRHRAGAFAAVVSLVAVLAALAVSLWQTRRVAAERDRAEARFHDARQIANALIFKVHDGVTPLAGSTPVRKMIVAEALTYLERLSQDPSVDDQLRLELASGYYRVGMVQGGPGSANLGDRAGARTSLQQAAALLEPMVARPGARPEEILQLGNVERELASVLDALADRSGMMAALTSAMTRFERLVAAHPTHPEGRAGLAACLQRMAFGQPTNAEAIRYFERSAALFEGLLQEAPDNRVRQRNVALIAKYLGARFETDGELDKARARYARAMELDEQRLAAEPLNRNALFDVAIDIGNVATMDWKANRLQQAAEGFERSLAMRQKLSALDPQDVEARSRVAFMHGRLANFYRSAKRLREAVPHARQAVAIDEVLAAVATDYRDDLGVALLTLGEVEALAANRSGGCHAWRRSHAILDPLLRASANPTDEQRKQVADLEQKIRKCG